jgi:hypothetical protein
MDRRLQTKQKAYFHLYLLQKIIARLTRDYILTAMASHKVFIRLLYT